MADSLKEGRVALIGCGKMGEAMLAGWLAASSGAAADISAADILIVGHTAERCAALEQRYDVRTQQGMAGIADADLIGWPLQIIVGKRGLAEGKVELKRRRTGERSEFLVDALPEMLAFANRKMMDMHKGGVTIFSGLFD